MYQALYRKYRPSNFDEVVGQKIVVKTLINAIENNKISHAYIFSGPRGTGKTSIAKIFAKTINCEHPNNHIPCNECSNCIDYNNKKTVDIIEIDAASNNGVDEIRNLKSSVNLVPNNSKYKVYIIDEVHMLSTSAFNALLKTLEEPPRYVIFILATTELYKVPETIISRCQNFDFGRITVSNIVSRLSYICECENIKIDEDALKGIATYSNGGMRDAIGLLDQLSSYKNDIITVDDVEDICGLISNKQMFELIDSMLENDLKESIDRIIKYNDDGKNLLIIFEKMVDTFKNILIYNNASDYFTDKKLKEKLELYSSKIEESKIYDLIDIINDTNKNMKFENNKLLLSELCLIKINSLLNNNKQIVKKDVVKQLIINNDETKNSISQEIKSTSTIKNEIINLSNFKEFKNVRINNALATFNRKDLLDFKEKLLMIKDYVSSEKYGSVVSLLLDGELKAKGNNYIIYVYNDSKMTDFFNNKLREIETFMLEIFKQQFKVISATLNEWEIIKKDFNNSLKNHEKKYTLMKDVELIIPSDKTKSIEPNDIDNMFSEIVKYE